ncbi:hypothetical protein M378DRAFT_15986 [Amanita muscaria Koide BX008]|uniref:NACHT domain-containing protein n=1 Tax=Amanita muscaria (strain Koide BX008) TaxID=946122 RepID=A0A0C2WNM4_AMAMK|nr:hypothetical protein M378DRAFT_15986 [Amanita muscaria Koide BX008]
MIRLKGIELTSSSDGPYSEMEMDVIRGHISNAIALKLPDINDIIRKHSLNQAIITLPRPQAAYNDYQNKKNIGPCFRGTRESLLHDIADWVSGTDGTRMYVLSGLAGIGKSTVAYTIAARADELGLLGASFFFSRDEADRSNAKMFFSAIAYQLCLFSEPFAQAIGNALLTKRGSAAITKDPQEQLEALILVPLWDIVQSRVRPILIVVDALDECDEEDAITVLRVLSQLVRNLPSFNVILTTRPRPHFDHFFGSQDSHKIFHMQDIEDKVVDGDIRLYLRHSLSQEQVRERLQNSEEDWYASDTQIAFLVGIAGKLFIIASTAVRYILDKFASDPEGQMQQLLRASAQDRTPFKDLSHFYTIILRSPVPANCDDASLVERYQAVVGTIMLIHIPLPIVALAHLIGVDVKQIRIVLRKLQSVILLGSDDIPHIYHKSFADHITDSTRCQDINLLIDPRSRHTQITIRCFHIMEQHLKYNILDLGDPARFMSNQDGLARDGITDKQLEVKISQQLRYACIYWANHLVVAHIASTDLMRELERFADQHMLHWFEVLSLIRELDSAHRAILVVLNLLPPSSDLHRLLSDGLRFISKFYQTIKLSALHTYHSALAFTPTGSLLYRRYFNGAIHNTSHVSDVTGGPDNWDTLVARLSHGEQVDDVQFSLNNTMFASRSGVLKVWDAATGTPVSMIRGSSLAIANDFSTFASFKDNTIKLYNTNGSERGVTLVTGAKIFGVAISSESGRIAAGLSDGTFCLWNSGNGGLIGSFREFAGNYRYRGCLQFSATGARLAYSSTNGVVKLRDGIEGRLIANLDCGSKDFSFWRVAFSGDGTRIATLSFSNLKLWSSEDGELVGVTEDAGTELAISANGSLLATLIVGGVQLWSGNSGNPLRLVQGLDIDLDFGQYSLAFSPDDILAIATLSNLKLYNVKSRSFISTLSFTGTFRAPVAFSPDCTRLAAGNSDGTVYLWDIRGIEASSSSTKVQASNRITALALSRDCSQVACGFWNGAIELWKTGGLAKQRIATRKNHPLKVTTLGFSPNGRQYASGSGDGTINLWNGEGGMLRGAFHYRTIFAFGSFAWLYAVGVSNSVLAAAGTCGIVLWNPQTLDRIHTFTGSFRTPLSFSDNGALLVAVCDTPPRQIIVFDVTKHAKIAGFDNSNGRIRATAFLPDNSQLVVQLFNDNFLMFNLVNKEVIRQPVFEDIIQLCNMPLWYGVPVWVNMEDKQLQVRALFSQHDHPVPVLWIPQELHVQEWAQGRSIIALGCEDGRFVLLRLPTNRVA